MENGMRRIPVTARMEIINGEAVMVSAEWADIPAEVIAKYLVSRPGLNFLELEKEAGRCG